MFDFSGVNNMEEISSIVSAIGSVGFSAVMCLVLVNFMKDQMQKLTDAVNNNTIVVSRLLERLKKDDDER